MAKQRYINTKFWDDEYISNLDPSEKLLFLYCLTNPATNISGAYEIPLKRIATDTGFDKDMNLKMFIRFERDDKIVYRDGWIVILNFIKHQNTESSTVRKGISENLKNAPQWVTDTLCIRYGEGIIYLNLNLDLNSNLDLTKEGDKPTIKKQSDIPPSLYEVSEYISLNTFGLDAQWFIDYYSARGWMVGRYKMKDWQAAIRTCERNRINWDKKGTPTQNIQDRLKANEELFNEIS